jgi:glycerol-3-phosphate dehydrogenase
MIVNAAGPWVDEVIAQALGRNDAHNVRLVKGSHVVTRRLFEHDRCYFFQNGDGRIFFAIPYEHDFTLIGTTDLDYDAKPGPVTISDGEIDYLLAAAGEYFADAPTRADIVWTYAGVRPLFDDGASAATEATRDYVLRLADGAGAPVVNVFGGKLTTYRRLAQKVVDMIGEKIGRKGGQWTRSGALPGGDFPTTGYEALAAELVQDYPGLPTALLRRLARSYGTLTRTLLGEAKSVADLGQHFGSDLYAREVGYLAANEWAVTAHDILWRRSKLGLRLDAAQWALLERYLKEHA